MLLAVGGNSLIRAGEKGTVAEQRANARRTAAEIVGLCQAGYQIVLTHGNGPQVGAALLRSERAASLVPGHPLDVCDAATQGEIGYLLQQALETELTIQGVKTPVVTVVTQSVVSPEDPAMQRPTKPIGPFYSRAEAEERSRQFGWEIVEDAARGYRRVVPSPEPIEIMELEVIRDLAERGVLVIACGGGGIPVLFRRDEVVGVEAVIDKDRVSSLLASDLEADLFLISTSVERVALHFGTPRQQPLSQLSAQETRRYLDERQFPPGSMGPKIEAALDYLERGGKLVIITSPESIPDALAGLAGTRITP